MKYLGFFGFPEPFIDGEAERRRRYPQMGNKKKREKYVTLPKLLCESLGTDIYIND